MLRRDFLKYLSAIPFVGALFSQGESGACEGQRERPSTGIDPNSEWVKQCEDSTDCWRFYINDEEVDVNRAVDEYGALHWPFQGAKDGDLCSARSPKTSVYVYHYKPLGMDGFFTMDDGEE